MVHRISGFQTVVIVNAADTDREQMAGLRHRYVQRTQRHYTVMMNFLNFRLMSNPYHDILDQSLEFKELEIPVDVQIGFLTRIQFTDTFTKWRKMMKSKEHVRLAFLSVLPRVAIANISPDDCERCIEQLQIINNFHHKDHHLASVLKRHITMLRRKQGGHERQT
jgi:hypothetical protein